MEEKISPGWSGIITREVIEQLAQAIAAQFVGKLFSTLWHSSIRDPSFPQRSEAVPDMHRHLDKIEPFPDADLPCIYIIAQNNWSILVGSFVCLSKRALLVESEHDVWCWMLEN
jgi:hypothetical protein